RGTPEGCWKGAPHSSQNLAPDRFSCWHRGHCIPPSGVWVGEDRDSRPSLDCRRPGGQLPGISSSPPPFSIPIIVSPEVVAAARAQLTRNRAVLVGDRRLTGLVGGDSTVWGIGIEWRGCG